MKVELPCLDLAIKPSPISKGVPEIQITLQGIKPNNMTHVSHEGTTSGQSS
jgi:hypothetical protein